MTLTLKPKLPTVFENLKRPRKHSCGIDEIYTEWYRCPKCGNNYILDCFHYCPNCGIKLRFDEEEDT